MMKNKLFSILIFLVLVFSMELQAQPSWHFNNTGNNHTILIQNSIEISVDGIQVLPGDYIGVFYDSLGSLACGGYMQWQGNTSTLAAWGAQSGNVDGFAQGEEFTWKIWIASNQSEFLSTVIYISGMFPNQGNFTVNGMSGLQSLLATSPQPPSPGWYYENTPLVHSIIIPDTISILLNGNPIVSGDYLGVFYDSLGTQACGGYLCRTGQTDTLLAYGQTSGNNAFSAGEEFSWKIWRASNEVSAWANVNYYTQNISDSAFFINGGLSQLATLSAISGKDLGITDLLWPQNSCSNLGSNESLEIEFTNFGNGSLFDFNLEVHINESWFDTLLQVSAIIPPDSSLSISFPLNLDLSDTGSYNFKAYLHYFGDLIPQNDSLKQTIHNYPLPQIFITNLDTAYCQSNNAHVALTGFPTGGYFTGNNVLNNAFYPAVTGFSTIQYFYSDNETGCNNNITEIVEVLESPQIDLGSDQIACQGDTVILEVSAGFAFYQWSNGLGNNNQAQVLYPDNYGLTVTAQNSCTAIDEILVSFNPLPIIQIQGDSAACMGDSVMLDAGFGFDFYAWQTEPAIYSQQVYVHESGVYPVIVSLDNCSSTDSFYVDFLPLPDIEISGKDTACQGESVKLDAGPGYGFYQWSNSMNNWDQTTTVYQTGYYWVRVSGENNCMGIDSIYVQFFPYPEIEFEPTSFLCSGDTVLLNPGKADEYLWSTGETTNEIYALESGNYSLTITSNKCSNSEAVYLTFFAAPDLSFLYEKQFHRVEFTNTSTIEDSYRWFFGDNYNSRLFEPSHVYPDTGSYVVQLESINDCGYSLVSDTIKITDVDKGFSFKKPTYFPNPGNGIFRISFSLYESLELSFKVFNVRGEKVFSSSEKKYPIGENIFMLDLSHLNQGFYFIEWTSELGSFSNKLIIVKEQ